MNNLAQSRSQATNSRTRQSLGNAIRMNRVAISAALILLCIPRAFAAPTDVDRKARSILSDACFHCHGPDRAKRKADLRLDSEEGKKVVVPGKASDSELFRRITSKDPAMRMPPENSGRKLTEQQIQTIRTWLEHGAKWERHWSYAPLGRPEVPQINDPRGAAANPIDAFVIARLKSEGLTPAPEAPATTLIRRVTLDLTGLPPTPEEVDEFIREFAAKPQAAYAKLVDRLLASQRFGERLAYDWLDAARYADSNGYQSDRTRTLWPWRDWVVRAFNDNMPFDRFTVEQIAGDLIPNATLSQKIATGFNRNHMLNGEGGRIAEESRVEYVVDRVDTTMTVWQGLSFGCARCHDHKYDPFTAKDYYRVSAFFNSISESGSVDRGGNANPVARAPTAEQEKEIARLNEVLADLDRQIKKTEPKPLESEARVADLLRLPPLRNLGFPGSFTPVSKERRVLQVEHDKTRKALDELNKAVPETMIMEERPQPRDTFILIRGAYDKPGEKVLPGVPEYLAPLPKDAPNNRLGFARWLVSAENPLTARVIVNRYWQLLFGAGLVRTPEDFGVQGEAPTHADLLDWLAADFVRSSWDLKKLLRQIVTSSTYRQSSKVNSDLRERDPDNRLLARGPRFRLSSQIIRDQALFVSGLLVEKMGGPPVKPYQPAGIWEEMTFNQIRYQQDKGENLYRRSLYTFIRRTAGPPNLFDAAARQVCVVKPSRTNTPLHALITLNDPTYVEAARVLAERMMTKGGDTLDDRFVFGMRLLAARSPTDREMALLRQAFERLVKHYRVNADEAKKLIAVGESPRNTKLDPVEHAAYTTIASLLMNLDEVLTKE